MTTQKCNVDFWRENSNIFTLQLNIARIACIATNVVKGDFKSYCQTLCLCVALFLVV